MKIWAIYKTKKNNKLSTHCYYEEAYSISYSTWNCVPTFHWSNSAKEYEAKQTSMTTHSDWYYKKMPILDIGDVDIILESKMKEKALLKYIAM